MLSSLLNYQILFFFVGSLITTSLLTPLVIYLSHKIGAIEHGGYRKINKNLVPLLGGISIAIPFIISLTIIALYINQATQYIDVKYILSIGLGCIGIVCLGIYDDIFTLRANLKLLGQCAIAIFTVLVCLHGQVFKEIYLPFLGNKSISATWSILICTAWIVGLINAFNLIDGIDGLASEKNLLLILASAALSGSLLAFLFFNFHPAKIFLGDTGSMFLGYVIAVLTLLSSYRKGAAIITFVPLLVVGLPIFEMVLSIIRRYVSGLPIFTGDSHHIHHRLLNRGYSQRKVVLILYGTSFFMAVLAISEMILPNQWRWLPMLLFIATFLLIAWFSGYFQPGFLGKLKPRRKNNILLQTFTNYVIQSYNTHRNNKVSQELLANLCCAEFDLNFFYAHSSNKTLLQSGSKNLNFSVETINIKSSNNQDTVIEYQFNNVPTELKRHDISIFLAKIFSSICV